MDLFKETGFDLEDFGDDSIVIRSMPDDIMGVEPQSLFDALLNSLAEDTGSLSHRHGKLFIFYIHALLFQRQYRVRS